MTTNLVASHHHIRENAGLFDVGHMVQTTFVLYRVTSNSLKHDITASVVQPRPHSLNTLPHLRCLPCLRTHPPFLSFSMRKVVSSMIPSSPNILRRLSTSSPTLEGGKKTLHGSLRSSKSGTQLIVQEDKMGQSKWKSWKGGD